MNRTKLPSKARALVAVIATALCFAAAFLTGCAAPDRTVETPLPSLTPPESTPKVHSVAITYNDKTVDGMLSVDLSFGSIELDAVVKKDDGAQGKLTFDSSNKSVATVENDGKVTLCDAGDTVITAKYGSESSKILLSVESGVHGKYTVTVVDGRANVTTATVGDIVTLTAVRPEHKDFSEWIFTDSQTPVTWVNGNMFKMPAGDVTIKAAFKDTLYTLRLVGGKVTSDGSASVQQGVVTGYDGSASDETAITEYKYAYNTPLTFSAVKPSSNRMFVGWDQNTVNNRIDAEMKVTGFGMPDETTTYWANYSDITTKKLLNAEKINIWQTTPIDGTLSNADPVFEGFSGYTFKIPGNTGKMDGYNECICGSVLNTVDHPSQAIRAIFRNRGDRPVTVELYASYLTNIATSGWVTVPAGQVITKTFVAILGFSGNPWWGFSVREYVGSGNDIPLDIAVGCADAYPKGDKTLGTVAGTVFPTFVGNQFWAQYGDASSSGPSIKGHDSDGRLNGSWIYAANYEHYRPSGVFVFSCEFDNLPEYDPEDPYMTVYIRLVNQAGSDHSYTYTFALKKDFGVPYKCVDGGANNEPEFDTDGNFQFNDGVAFADCTVSNHGQTELIALRVPRSKPIDGEKEVYQLFFMMNGYSTPDKTKPEVVAPYYANNYSIIMTYNNGIGFDGDFTEPKNTGVNA